jgi:carboxypeptidase PM20D1
MSIAALVAITILSVLGVALFIALARALMTPRSAPPAEPLPESALEEAAGIESALAALIRHPTVSYHERAEEDDKAFAAFKAELARLFPRVHAELSREEIGERALLFTWRGRAGDAPPATELRPVILCAHFDVVPAEDAELWRHPPFSGDLAELCVWGRGAQDIKLTLASALHAAERLLAGGFRPERTIYFAFGGDEETGGTLGARRLGEALAARGVRDAFLLDEGGPVAEGMLGFVDRPIALVGIAEKGYIDVLVEAKGQGGHASMPPRRTATGILARAVVAIERSPSRARLGYTVRSFLKALAPYSPLAIRLLFRNLWLFAPLVKAVFSASATTNAMVRTTYAPTMLQGSAGANVLADSARGVVNVRILPGEDSAGVLARLGRIAARAGAEVRPAHLEDVKEPLPESPLDHEGYRAIRGALSEAFPEAACVPFLFSASTDTKHYRGVAAAMYRLTPLRQSSEQLNGVHGRDERVAVAELRRCEIFYHRLIRGL